MKKYYLLAIVFLLIGRLTGCAALGTADRTTMMNKWEGKPVTENLLADINGYGNWYAKGDPTEPGKCVDQAMFKAGILEELGIPYKFVDCVVARDYYNPIGHKFLIAQLNKKWMVMDNGAVSDVVWEYEAVKKSTWGVTNWHIIEK